MGHQRLLHKLHYYGIRNTTLTWISGWLTGRTQKVVVDGESSGEAAVISGVPQGTVLGPLMFILYINDIDNETSSSIRLFADDCLLYRTVSCTRDASELQRDLKQMCRWADLWQMNFNATKCHVLSVTKKTQPLMFPYTIGGQQLQHVTHHPYLGVELGDDLSWGTHLDKMIPKAQRTLNLLRRNLSDCSQNIKDVVFKTLVRPVLEYASTSWDPYQAKHIHRMENVQRRAARFVTGQHQRHISVNALMQDLQWRSLQERRLTVRLCMFYKAVNGHAACDIPDHMATTQRRTRTSHNLQHAVPSTNTGSYRFSFFPRTIKIWNILPAASVNAPNVDSFKTAIQHHFLNGTIYTVPPKGQYDRPRLGSSGGVATIGPVY